MQYMRFLAYLTAVCIYANLSNVLAPSAPFRHSFNRIPRLYQIETEPNWQAYATTIAEIHVDVRGILDDISLHA